MVTAWLGFAAVWGKRRDEISRLKRRDIWIQDGYLFVRFYVGKKEGKTKAVVNKMYLHKKTLEHYAMPYILQYLKEWDTWRLTSRRKTEYLFPYNRKPSQKTVHTLCTLRDGSEELRAYTYNVPGGYMSGGFVYRRVMLVNPFIWLHLSRSSVGTAASEDGASLVDIANILDISKRTAEFYALHGTQKTEQWNDKKD